MSKRNRAGRIQQYAFNIQMPLLREAEITRLRDYLRSPLRRFLYRHQDIIAPLIIFNILLLFMSIAVDFGSVTILAVDVVKKLAGYSPDDMLVIVPLAVSLFFGAIDFYITAKMFEWLNDYHSSEYLKHPKDIDEYVYLHVAGWKQIPTLNDLTEFLTDNPEYVPYARNIAATRPVMQGEFESLQSLAALKNLD